jgi:AcrR family transcriptional regulator
MNDDTATTHERLLHEAAALFARRGYSGTSMSDIAKEVGVRKASLYNYYSSKEDLLMALLEQSVCSWAEACAQDLAEETDLEDRLAVYLQSLVVFARTNPQAMALIRLATAQVPGDLRPRVQAHLSEHEAQWHAELTEHFRQAVESGEVQPADPAALALAWGIFLDGIAVRFILATERTDVVVNNLQTLWNLFWRGLTGNDARTEISV